jgi:hypothetical protein
MRLELLDTQAAQAARTRPIFDGIGIGMTDFLPDGG